MNLSLRVYALESVENSVDTTFYLIVPWEMRAVLCVNLPSPILFVTHGHAFPFHTGKLSEFYVNLTLLTRTCM